MQAFLAKEERIPEHMDDPRFRVYLMLASLLPLRQATELRETLVESGSGNKRSLPVGRRGANLEGTTSEGGGSPRSPISDG